MPTLTAATDTAATDTAATDTAATDTAATDTAATDTAATDTAATDTAATDTAATELVLIAVLERREQQARVLRDRVARIVTEQRAAAPDEPLSHDAELWQHGAYIKWSEAWEALTAAREALAG